MWLRLATVPVAYPYVWVVVASLSQESGLGGIRTALPAGPSLRSRSRRRGTGRRNPQCTRGENRSLLHLDGGRQLQRGARAPQGAGRGGHGDLSPQLSGSSRRGLQREDGQGLPAPAAASAVQATIIQLPVPSTQEGWGGGKTCGGGCQSQRVFAFPWDRWEV